MTTFESPRPQDKVSILKRIPVFASCSEEQLLFIGERTRLVEYKKGEYVYRQGDPADAFYIISSGRLRVFSLVGEHEKTLAIFHNGDSFGEISLLTGETHSATVEAINDALVLQLAKRDFDDVINRIPSLVLYLSRLLSKRLRSQQHTGEFVEATIVALQSAAKGVGRTSFAVALAASLKQETGKETVIVDFSHGEGSQAWLYGATQPTQTIRHAVALFDSTESYDAALSVHPFGFSVLSASELLLEADAEHIVAPLLSSLTKRFAYILIDLPVDISPPTLKALTQADLIYLVTDANKERVLRTKALIHQVESSVGTLEQRLKVILNMVGASEESLRLSDVTQQLGLPVTFTLPYASSGSSVLSLDVLGRLLETRTSPYALTVRRIARELGGLLVGLALGSGAALGLAHVGILKVLERERIPIDMIAGTSIGAMIAALWATGRSGDELEQMALRFKNPWGIFLDLGIPVFSLVVGFLAGLCVGWLAGFWAGFFFGFIVTIAFGLMLGPLAGGPIQGAQLMARLQEDFAGKTFEDAWPPLKVIAANPVAREEVVFESGPIAEAVRASVSIPGIFKPVTYKGKVCLDGGVIDPIPVSILKRSGANRVIAVNVFPTTPELAAYLQDAQRRRAERDAQFASRSLPMRLLLRVRQELMRSISPLVFDVIMRSMQAMEYQIAEISCRDADITLRPTLPGSHWLEFYNPEKFILRGEEIALQHLPELRRLAGVREPNVDKPAGGQ